MNAQVMKSSCYVSILYTNILLSVQVDFVNSGLIRLQVLIKPESFVLALAWAECLWNPTVINRALTSVLTQSPKSPMAIALTVTILFLIKLIW